MRSGQREVEGQRSKHRLHIIIIVALNSTHALTHSSQLQLRLNDNADANWFAVIQSQYHASTVNLESLCRGAGTIW